MDQGRPLENSPPGPWTSHLKSKATPLPILQHHHKMVFRTTINRQETNVNASAEVQQSTAIIPLQYDSLIALVDLGHRAPHDPLSMCIPLYAHAAFSEVQFLNLMESKIQIQINTIAAGVPDDALETLHYLSNILNRHAQQLKGSSRALHRLVERSNGVRAVSLGRKGDMPPGLGMSTHLQSSETETRRNIGSSSADGTYTAKGIVEDYEQLYVRCTSLSKLCMRGITLAMNKATIDESRKAIEQSERLKKLTLLASLFIPISFCSSLFGMNIDLLGQGTVKFWWFFVLCVPITLCTYILYLWDLRYLRQCWARFWKLCCDARRELISGRSSKDQSHIV
jgi:Mg2+ and Co2+ transporter CorA